MPRKVSIDKFYLLLIYGKDKKCTIHKNTFNILSRWCHLSKLFFYFRVFFKQIIMEKIQTYY